MKNLKYLNGVLTVIAACLVLLTLSAVGLIPKANASNSTRYATVPVNPDGSITVKIDPASSENVNIKWIGGLELSSITIHSQQTPYIPVIVLKQP